MIINTGIINNGNNNLNNIDNSIDFNEIIEELYILKDSTNESLDIGIEFAKKEDIKSLKRFLKTLSKDTIKLIKQLGLITLEKLIEKIIFNK